MAFNQRGSFFIASGFAPHPPSSIGTAWKPRRFKPSSTGMMSRLPTITLAVFKSNSPPQYPTPGNGEQGSFYVWKCNATMDGWHPEECEVENRLLANLTACKLQQRIHAAASSLATRLLHTPGFSHACTTPIAFLSTSKRYIRLQADR